MKKNNKGYILILTLMMLSILVILVTSMFFNETAHTALTRTMIDREKAKLLALSGIQLAMSKLTVESEQKSKKETDKKEAKSDKKDDKPDKKDDKKDISFLKKILPMLNKWQTIKLNENIDGVDGQINLYIACENGKININEIYNYANHKFQIGSERNFDSEKFFQELSTKINQIIVGKDLFKGLKSFLSKREFPLNETTELLEIPEFSYFHNHIFCDPKQSKDANKSDIYLTDIFTIWTDSNKIQPLVLSDSIITILGLKKTDLFDANQRQKILEPIFKQLNKELNWKSEWNKILKPFYLKDFETLIKGIENLFDNAYDPKTFSVVSYGTVGNVTQRLYAILEIETDNTSAKIKKLYFI